MGRQWFGWGGGGRSSSSGKNPRKPPPANTTGCMCAVLQIFDLPPHRPLSSFLQQQDDHFEPTPKGVEAPRNSLEMEEIMVLKPAANVALKRKGEETKILNNVSVGINQIRTSCEFSSSECSSSSPGGARTPNLVARLMGLDLLPENHNNGSSPASTLSSSSRLDRARYLLHRSGTLSLPETPRMSTTRKSDVEIYLRNRHHHHHHHHHRLSLQISKENVGMGISEDDEASKRVKRIVKHLKESRKFGLDITNTAAGERCRKHRFLDTSTQVVLLKPNRPSAGKTEDPPVKQPQKPKCNHHQEIPNGITNSYKNTRRTKPPPQKEETFVRPALNTAQENKKGVKRATLLSRPNNVPTILPAVMKKDRRPSPAPEKSVKKQIEQEKAVLFVQKSGALLSSSPSQTYKSPAATTAAPPLELEYIQRVLKRAGIEKETPVTWHSYSPPLNPSIFNYMELLHHSTLKRRSDRRLIFHLADELLAGILKSRRESMTGSDLAEALCFKILELPSGDIDALIDGDWKKSDENERDEEVEGLVGEIERHVAQALVEETAAVALEVARPYRWRRGREGSQALTF